MLERALLRNLLPSAQLLLSRRRDAGAHPLLNLDQCRDVALRAVQRRLFDDADADVDEDVVRDAETSFASLVGRLFFDSTMEMSNQKSDFHQN